MNNPNPPTIIKKNVVSGTLTLPCGSGLPFVLAITASIFCSTKQFNAAAAPATNAIPIVPKIRVSKGTAPGTAINIPITAVKTISDTTRGLVNR